jgi:hypothetical protein
MAILKKRRRAMVLETVEELSHFPRRFILRKQWLSIDIITLKSIQLSLEVTTTFIPIICLSEITASCDLGSLKASIV